MNLKRRLIGCAVALAVLGAAGYGFWGQYPAAKVERACGGMLPVDPVLNLTGKSRWSPLGIHYEVFSGQSNRSFGAADEPATRCEFDGANITIEPSDRARTSFATYTKDSKFPLPLNAGWQGFMLPGDEGASATLLLNCRNWSETEGSGILVSAGASYDYEAPEKARLDLARLLTGAAQRAADKSGCETDLGSGDDLTDPGTGTKSVPADKASGTCEGMTSASTVRETAAGTSPIEKCGLTGGLRLLAHYGPYSDARQAIADGKYAGHKTPSGIDRSTAWTTATCKGALGLGYYHASVSRDSDRDLKKDPLTKAERADLAHFAERSAARHGCDTPAALS